jgi:hypothetical protein
MPVTRRNGFERGVLRIAANTFRDELPAVARGGSDHEGTTGKEKDMKIFVGERQEQSASALFLCSYQRIITSWQRYELLPKSKRFAQREPVVLDKSCKARSD